MPSCWVMACWVVTPVENWGLRRLLLAALWQQQRLLKWAVGGPPLQLELRQWAGLLWQQ